MSEETKTVGTPEKEKIKPGKAGELWLIDAIDELIKEDEVYAVEIANAKYYDTGDKLGYLKTVVDFALKHKDFGDEFKKYLQEKAK